MSLFNETWEDYFAGKINHQEFVDGLSNVILMERYWISKKDRDNIKIYGFTERDVDFISHLNFHLSSPTVHSQLHKFLIGHYDTAGRTVSNKFLRGHMSIQELKELLNKFKGDR